MAGKLYGVGVGPGDPELMTVKAINTIRSCDVVAFPGENCDSAVSYSIASKMIPELGDKVLQPVRMPMSEDVTLIERAHNEAACKIEKYLVEGMDVAFLVLGDVAIYSTFMYLNDIISNHGFETAIISGITSFSAAAAASRISLCQWDENLIVIPSRHQLPDKFEDGKNYVLMKAGSRLKDIRILVKESGRRAICVENCGMVDEKLYMDVDSIPDKAGYYSIVIVK